MIAEKKSRHQTDIMSSRKRSQLMSKIGPQNTKPELAVRAALLSLGYRYRLHERKLPGKPDIILPTSHTTIFVHGCFWHQHPGCRKATIPKQNTVFWKTKLTGNRKRDLRVENTLRQAGWHVLVIWECKTKNKEILKRTLTRRLNPEPQCTRL